MANIKLSTIEDRLQIMRRVDNGWADQYVRDVSHLLTTLSRAHEVLEGLRNLWGCWCNTYPFHTNQPACLAAQQLWKRLETERKP